MSKITKTKHRKRRGGAYDRTALDYLLLIDSYHDFWNCDRGQFKGNDKLKSILNAGLLYGTIKYTGIEPYPLPQPYSPQQGARAIIPQYADYKSYADAMFKMFPNPFNEVNVSNIEKSTVVALANPDPSEIFSLSDSDLADGNKQIFMNIVTAALGESFVEQDDVFILCDAGFGNMGKVGKASDILRGIITPQVIADSANTTITPISSKPNIYYAPESTENTRTFVSDSNCLTKEDGYVVSYVDNGINDNNPYNFSLIVSDGATPLKADFSPNTNTGPSASLLGGCFLYNFLNLNKELVYDQDTVIGDIGKRLQQTKGTKAFRAKSNVLDIWAAFNTVPNPYLFIDLKRGGDRDQIKAAVLASTKFNNVIFCTGDLLCAVAAVKNGLPTIYQLPKKNTIPAAPATITVWKKGIGLVPGYQFGGNKLNVTQVTPIIYNIGSKLDSLSEEELLAEESGLTGQDLLIDATSQAAACTKSLLSSHYPEFNQFCLVQNVLNEINIVKSKSIINSKMCEPLVQAIKTYSIVSGRTNIPTVINSDTTLTNIENGFNELVASLEIQLSTQQELYRQAWFRTQLLEKNTESFNDDILNFLETKYNGKFADGSGEKNMFSAIKTILAPYSNTGIKAGHPASEYEPVTAAAVGSKNLYMVGLLTLTLINDMISNSAARKTSFITNILFGASYSLRYSKPISNDTLQSYSDSIFHIARSIIVSKDGKQLVSSEVLGLIQSGGKSKHKTLKRSKNIRRRKHMKTQHKRK